MRVLLLGATGNLGRRLLPALLAHGHIVVAYIRSESKLRSLVSPRLADKLIIRVGDAFDSARVEAALRENKCDAIMNTAGNHAGPFREQYLHKIATAVSSAAVRYTKSGGNDGRPLRLWIVGGVGSLVYGFPENLQGERYQTQDFMPYFAMEHLRGVEDVVKVIPTSELEWSLICVAWMWSSSDEKRDAQGRLDLLDAPRGNDLVLRDGEMVEWEGTWVGSIPWMGRMLDLFWCVGQFSTKLADVADMIAADLAKGDGRWVGKIVGMKDRSKMKAKSM